MMHLHYVVLVQSYQSIAKVGWDHRHFYAVGLRHY